MRQRRCCARRCWSTAWWSCRKDRCGSCLPRQRPGQEVGDIPVTIGDVLLDRYIVERVLGEGGMGRVYLGRHVLLGMPAALKVLSVSSMPGMAQRFEREAKLMARVRHPNVVAILDYGFLSDGAPCIAMEFADGEPLDQRLRRVGTVHWETALSLMIGVLSGLDAMHSADVLHRDLKPSNIVVTHGRQEQARLIDFGIALPTGAADQRLAQTGAIIGTPAYMAPEQLLCYPMDAGTDVYAAGLIFYELLAGGPPFPAHDLSGVMRRLREALPRPVQPPLLPTIPRFVADAVMASLVPEHANRIRTAEDFLGRLRPPQPAGTASASPACASPAPPAVQAGRAVQTPVRESFATAETMLQAADALPRMTEAQFGTLPTQVLDPQLPAMPGRVAEHPPSMPGSVAEHPTGGPGAAGQEGLAGSRQEGTAAASRAEPRGRYLVAARLLPSRLALPAERKFLGDLAGMDARAYALGGAFWFALQNGGKPLSAAQTRAGQIADELRARYGASVAVAWDVVDEKFAFSASALTGASSMPKALTALIEKLSARG